jgi:hypothetical protein
MYFLAIVECCYKSAAFKNDQGSYERVVRVAKSDHYRLETVDQFYEYR